MYDSSTFMRNQQINYQRITVIKLMTSLMFIRKTSRTIRIMISVETDSRDISSIMVKMVVMMIKMKIGVN